MQFSMNAIAALAAATSSSCFVSATASQKRKIAKKVRATGQTDGDIIPIGDPCTIGDNNCAIPPGLEHTIFAEFFRIVSRPQGCDEDVPIVF